VPRWEPNPVGRLQEAAIELFGEHGYDRTTVADIAERAGLTERTFFRYFPDKREVLFSGSELLSQTMARALRDASPETPPWNAMVAALTAAADEIFTDRFGFVSRRQPIIDAHAELRERELIKLESLARVLAETLHSRGAAAGDLIAEAGITLFKVAFASWIRAGGQPPLATVIHQRVGELRTALDLSGAPASEPPKRSRRPLRRAASVEARTV
jgi:AcrR family transcriptional regulator